MKTFMFKLVRKPYTHPLILKRFVNNWDAVLKEFPDAVYIGEY